MVTNDEFAEFLKCLDCYDPLGALVPKNLDNISAKWSNEDAEYLLVLLNMLEDTLNFDGSVFEREKNDERRFFFLDAICKIDVCPQSVPTTICKCLANGEDAIRRMALKYVNRAATVDEHVRVKIDEMVSDGRAYLSTRILAYLTRHRIKKRPIAD